MERHIHKHIHNKCVDSLHQKHNELIGDHGINCGPWQDICMRVESVYVTLEDVYLNAETERRMHKKCMRIRIEGNDLLDFHLKVE